MSTLNEDLEQIKNDENNIAASKVARFCYTEQAYQDDNYGGVPEFDPSAEQNIPLANPDTLKTNATVLDRGFRSQASSLPRMLINHFFGRVSYNLNKAHDNLVSLITAIKSFIGQPNGIASLDENGRIPYSQLPESALNLIGDWDADTNTPELSDGMEGATLGDMYYVTVGGTVDFGHGEISFFPNDRIMYNQYNQWVKLSAGNVRKVNNREPDASDGNVTVYGTDINVSETDELNLIEKMKQYVASTLLGRHWLQSDKADDKFSAVYYANGVWVAGSGSDTGLWYSTDGQHWLQSDKKDNNFRTVYYANGVWVAGTDSGTDSGTGLWYSTDGQHWLQSDKADDKFSAVYYANGVWVAGSDSGTGLWYSTDGQHWLQSDKTNNSFLKVYYANGVWVASSHSNTGLWYSTDGQHWLQSDKTNNDFYTVYYANGVWVAGSFSNTGLWYSTDGQHWLQSDKKDNIFYSVYYANGVWVAGPSTQSNTGLWYSTDGQHWLQSDKTNDAFNTVYYANGVWVAGSWSNTGLWYSTDGQHWLQSDKTNNSFHTVYYANGVWVAGSFSNSGTGLWYSSTQDIIDNGWIN